MISFIWAQTKSGIIGKDGKLPWSIPEEMKHFKDTTTGHAIVMGRKTFDSMNDKPLPNRMNYVMSRNTAPYKNLYAMKDLVFVDHIKPLVDKYENSEDILYVIGGPAIFKLFIPYAKQLIRTTIKKDYEGDVSMININYNEYKKYTEIQKRDYVIEYFKKEGVNN